MAASHQSKGFEPVSAVAIFQDEDGRQYGCFQPGDWATSLELTDSYFHVSIAPFFRKYLRIVINH